MNTYEIKGNIRQKVLLFIAVISLIVGNFLFGASNYFFNFIEANFPAITVFLDKWDYLGMFSSQITVATTFAIANWLFNNYIWKIPFVNKHLDVPNLNGVWEGELESSFKENGVNKKVDMKLEIKQTWNKMTCTSVFPKSASCSDIVCIDAQGSQGVVLKFTYTNQSENVELDLPQFVGYNELKLCNANKLSGTYYTRRTPATRGTISLVRSDTKDSTSAVVNYQ